MISRGGLTSSFFLCKICVSHTKIMDNEKLMRIIYNLENVLEELKLEINSDTVIDYEEETFQLTDYDEIFEETDDY